MASKRPRNRADRRIAELPRPTASATLIIECDSLKLASQGVTLAQDLASILGALAPFFPLQWISTTTEKEILSQFARVQPRDFSGIVAIGHSNRTGIQMTQDGFRTWMQFGKWIQPFAPETVFLAACEAGRWLPSKALLDSAPSLQTIYGSPTPTSSQEIALYGVLVPAVLYGIEIPQEVWVGLQLLNLLGTGGVIYRQTRRAFERAEPIEQIQWAVLEELTVLARTVLRPS